MSETEETEILEEETSETTSESEEEVELYRVGEISPSDLSIMMDVIELIKDAAEGRADPKLIEEKVNQLYKPREEAIREEKRRGRKRRGRRRKE